MAVSALILRLAWHQAHSKSYLTILCCIGIYMWSGRHPRAVATQPSKPLKSCKPKTPNAPGPQGPQPQSASTADHFELFSVLKHALCVLVLWQSFKTISCWAGSAGGVVEALCLQPIDVIKTRLQLDNVGKYSGACFNPALLSCRG